MKTASAPACLPVTFFATMSWWSVLRFVFTVSVLVCSAVTLGLSANFVGEDLLAKQSPGTIETYCLVIACLSFITMIPIMVIDLVRTGAFTSITAFELAWTGVLGILWLAAGAQIAQGVSSLSGGAGLNCGTNLNSAALALCNQILALEAFTFLAWLILWSWMFILLVLAIVAHVHGNGKVWVNGPAGLFVRRQKYDTGLMPAVASSAQPYMNVSQQYPMQPMQSDLGTFNSTPAPPQQYSMQSVYSNQGNFNVTPASQYRGGPMV